MADLYPDLKDRPLKDTICLFDVDNTLTPARLPISPEMRQTLARLRHKCAIGYVGGSNFPKQQEQIGTDTLSVKEVFDFCFAENGLEAYRLGQPLASTSFLEWIGEERYQKLAKWILRYISDLEGLPAMRGTFIEFRNGMINVSPVGRNASTAERNEFEAWDKKNNCRPKMIQALKEAFPDLAVTYSIGGQISFDVFPTGWDKTYCLRHVEAEADPAKGLSGIKYKTIHFFGDKCFEGGNDWEIYNDKRTIGHSVENPADCLKQIKEIFDL